jgi:hypothetical protein
MPKAKITFYSRVRSITRLGKQIYLGGFGEDAKFEVADKGYFMLLEGSYEALHIGFEEPDFKVGDRIKITMEKVNG